MSAFTAETNNRNWVLANDEFAATRERASGCWQEMLLSLGSTAMRREVEYVGAETASDDASLMAAISMASRGDLSSRRVVRTNVATDLYERNFKVGLSAVDLELKAGSLSQEGRKLTQIHLNTLKHTELIPEMHRRTTQELLNVIFLEDLFKDGKMEGHDALFFSPTSTNMTRQQKKDYNFFLATESMSVQLFSSDGSNVRLETALVAGKPTPDSERQDIKTVKELAGKNGVEIKSDDGTEILGFMMLVPKGSLENGVSDVVRMYDDVNGTFYGQDLPRQDYDGFRRFCIQRNMQFGPLVEKITDQLIQESGAFVSPIDAIMRLDELSERYSVRHAIENTAIDPRIFGLTSAQHIEEARMYHALGDHARAQSATLKAIDTAESGSCPLFKKAEGAGDGADKDNPFKDKEVSGKKWMSCPYCQAKVYADPCSSVLKCFDCSAKVVNGQVVSRGDHMDNKDAEKVEQSRRIAEAIIETLKVSGQKTKERPPAGSASAGSPVSGAGV